MRTLLAANAGGHLKQLISLRSRLPWDTCDVTWVTPDSAQSRSLLAGEDVRYLVDAPPRDLAAAFRNAGLVRRVLAGDDFSHAVSTGASVAVSSLPLARVRGVSAHYIESAARVLGPSMSGRMLRWSPGVRTYTQYSSWASGSWAYCGSVFDGYEADREGGQSPRISRVVVSVGSQEGYPFPALIRRLVDLLPIECDVVWQTGSTDVSSLPIDGQRSIPARALEEAVAEADLVVSHAGVGSALTALEAGKCPVLVPRNTSRGEHVDDHQVQIADELAGRGLCVTSTPAGLSWDDCCRAAAIEVRAMADPPALRLDA